MRGTLNHTVEQLLLDEGNPGDEADIAIGHVETAG
jgi:hypothetical protein